MGRGAGFLTSQHRDACRGFVDVAVFSEPGRVLDSTKRNRLNFILTTLPTGLLRSRLMDKIAQLIAAGFQNIGHWQLGAEGVTFVGQVPVEPGVYAFTANSEVCYIGSAQRGLRPRLRRYANLRNEGVVATRIREEITKKLTQGADVNVLTVACSPISWKGLPIDPIAGLEEGLIREWHPPWNLRGLGDVRKLARLTNSETLSQ
jgi:hypothetical protein